MKKKRLNETKVILLITENLIELGSARTNFNQSC